MIIEKDRYNSDFYYQKWLATDKSKDVIYIEDIEINNYDPKFADIVDSFWKNISEIDNYIQSVCDEMHRKSDWEENNFILDLAWIEIHEDGITLRYWGRIINVELGAECTFIDGKWEINNICYP